MVQFNKKIPTNKNSIERKLRPTIAKDSQISDWKSAHSCDGRQSSCAGVETKHYCMVPNRAVKTSCYWFILATSLVLNNVQDD